MLALAATAVGRASEGSEVSEDPLVVIYYENWAGWVREFSPSTLEKNILSRGMPVRNFVLNYAFYTWNPEECSVQPVDTVDLQKGDHGGWTADDWNIQVNESWETANPAGGHLPAFMMIKSKYPHIKLLPSIGGWSRSGTFHDCLINKSDVMLQSLSDFVIAWGWDGVDFDWEYPNCDGAPCGCQNEAVCLDGTGLSNKAGAGDWDRYTAWLKKVRSKFNELEDELGRRLYITAALGMNPKLIDGNNAQWSVGTPIEFVCDEDVFDWVNLMTYDFFGPWAAITGPLAPLYPNPEAPVDQMSIQESLDKILARCSKPYKLTMGLATYGKSWQSVPKTGTVPGLWQESTATTYPAGGTWELGTLSWFDIKNNILPKCTRTWDDVSKTPTLYCDSMPAASSIPYDPNTGPVPRSQTNVFITYEDGESWKYKMQYARSKGMGGAIIWAASDVGSGQSYSPESAADLFQGLFEGWTGNPVTIGSPQTNSFKFEPIKRWDTYPCPLADWYVSNDQPIDVSRCSSATFSPKSTYFVAKGSGTTSDIGKNNIMIVPTGGDTTQQTTTPKPTTTTPRMTTSTTTTTIPRPTMPTTAAPVPTTPAQVPTTPAQAPTTPAATMTTRATQASTTTKAHPKCISKPSRNTTPAPVASSTSLEHTECPLPPINVPTGTPPPPTTTTTRTTTSTNAGLDYQAMAKGCETLLAATKDMWKDICKNYCVLYVPGGSLGVWCDSPTSSLDLAKCVTSQFDFCVIKN
ncbi:chitinase [Gregarina niphandrodes]|uniref:Chitinase n=1 Tax=Gregarina niphandrodes TaxID=110365 RepID=A0A023B804_GRENI|nr:chitinase [Gregarina niphandrodes]EZG67975.1 chitinase [Gregarina niphandrodes]|eukprot:XP_011130124.1 chitinase [Gregarina niphandrodes]